MEERFPPQGSRMHLNHFWMSQFCVGIHLRLPNLYAAYPILQNLIFQNRFTILQWANKSVHNFAEMSTEYTSFIHLKKLFCQLLLHCLWLLLSHLLVRLYPVSL